MTFSEWGKQTSVNYKGYVIKIGSIWKDGDPKIVFPVQIDVTLEENASLGKAIIDEMESQATQ